VAAAAAAAAAAAGGSGDVGGGGIGSGNVAGGGRDRGGSSGGSGGQRAAAVTLAAVALAAATSVAGEAPAATSAAAAVAAAARRQPPRRRQRRRFQTENDATLVAIFQSLEALAEESIQKKEKGSTICPTSEIVCSLPVFIKLYVIRTEYVHRMSSYHLHFRIEFFTFGLSSFFFGTYLYVSIYIVN
jgi:hypothetical protein